MWQYAHALALDVYKAAARIRGSQHLALRSQLIRASASIPANIVEGRAKTSDRDFARFVGYALGSASELEYHLIMARDIGVVPAGDANGLISQLQKVRKMLHGLRSRLIRSNAESVDPPSPSVSDDTQSEPQPRAASAVLSLKPVAG